MKRYICLFLVLILLLLPCQAHISAQETYINFLADKSTIVENGGYYILQFQTDVPVTDSLMMNLQASADFASTIKSSLYINGKSIGELCTQAGHDYAAMVSLHPADENRQGLMEIWLDKVNLAGLDKSSYNVFEIKNDITLNKKNFSKAAFIYDCYEENWINSTAGNSVAALLSAPEISESGSYYLITLELSKYVTKTELNNIQASSDYKDAIRQRIYINGQSIESLCALAGHDYAAMVHIFPKNESGEGKLQIWVDKQGITKFDPEVANSFEIRGPISFGEAYLSPCGFSYIPEEGWSKTYSGTLPADISTLKLKDDVIYNIPNGITSEEFIRGISCSAFAEIVSDLQNDGKVATGSKLSIKYDNINTQYTLSVYGDVSEDGKVNVLDAISLRKHFLYNSVLSEAQKMAISADGRVNITNLLSLKDLLLKENQNINASNAPDEIEKNTSYSVYVRQPGSPKWQELFVYNTPVGTQEGDENSTLSERVNASMVNFDFSGTVDMKVVYNGGKINSYDIRPYSDGINAMQINDNSLIFPLTQTSDGTQKLVLRINDNWYDLCLHIMTGNPETDAPSENDENVYVIEAGDEIPLELPENKDTYYFKAGVHNLPQGMWADIDFGQTKTINSFELVQGALQENYFMTGPQKFELYAKDEATQQYRLIYDGKENSSTGTIRASFSAVSTSRVRIKLCGNNGEGQMSNYTNLIFANYVKELKLFERYTGQNVALGKACAGALKTFAKLTDGDENTVYASVQMYGNWHSAESFFISKDNVKVYLASGSYVYGSISADEINGVKIFGRGILDCSKNEHSMQYAEGRTGAIWITSSQNSAIDGITVIDSPMWSIVANYSNNIQINNVNCFGSVTNADGIHLSASSDSTVDNCFVRSCDDQFVIYHYGYSSNNIIKNSVFWGDGARIFLLGLGENTYADISNITFENNDILNQQGVWNLSKFTGVCWFWSTAGNKISNITVRDIRIDSFRAPEKASLFFIRNESSDNPFWSEGGAIRNIVFEDISYNGTGELKSILSATSEQSCIDTVVFNNFRKNSNLLTEDNISDMVSIRDYVKNIRFGE
ncbi:MAG: hypothetical protein E7480_04640 [Ruminococcaceae bacterium]|nr:hypothetical protein [Oscillospiraceae bacterium]